MNIEALQKLQLHPPITEEANEIIEKIISTLKDTLETLHSLNVPRRYMPMRAINLADKHLTLVSDIAKKLPYDFEFVCFEEKIVSQSQKVKMRNHFEAEKRSEFIKILAHDSNSEQQLRRMGLQEEDVNRFFRQSTVLDNLGRPLLITVDHIHDIGLGGTNDFRNLCILPGHINEIKDSFIRAQKSALPNEVKRVTFQPKDGIKIPYVEGGYKPSLSRIPSKQREDETQQRYKEFLGLKNS